MTQPAFLRFKLVVWNGCIFTAISLMYQQITQQMENFIDDDEFTLFSCLLRNVRIINAAKVCVLFAMSR